MQKKIRVAVLYGGRSGEHEVSLQSAASVIRHLDRARFEIVPIGIDKQGRWRMAGPEVLLNETKVLPLFTKNPEVVLPAHAEAQGLVAVNPTELAQGTNTSFDVVFPVMHGTNCEDGTIQGLLELAETAYVGCGVLASAVGMDKEVAKRLIRDAGLPVVPYVCFKSGEWKKQSSVLGDRIERELGFPCFVKPANSGSSVGVHKVKSRAGLSAAVEDALRYDVKILAEKAISAREIELSVLENIEYGEDPLVSVAGEIQSTHEFYSYESKYIDENGAIMKLPADITPEQLREAQSIAKRAFVALEGEGLSRVDLFLDKDSGSFYFNEVNTLPGFTSISMYPKMWEASGLSYSALLTKLIELALARHARRKALVREFSPSA